MTAISLRLHRTNQGIGMMHFLLDEILALRQMLTTVNDKDAYDDTLHNEVIDPNDSRIAENSDSLQEISKTINTLRLQIDKLHGEKSPDGETLLNWEKHWKDAKYLYLETWTGQ